MKIKFLFFLSFSFSICGFSQLDTSWTRCIGGSGNEADGFGAGFSGSPFVSMVSDDQGNIYVASYSTSNDGIFATNAGLEDVVLVKLNPQGNVEWAKTFGGSQFERCHDLILLSDGNVLLAGRTASSSGSISSQYGAEDAFLLKVNPSGEIVWSRSYGGSQLDYFFGVREIPGSNGELIAYGMSGSIDGLVNDNSFVGSNKAWLVRLAANGDFVWSKITNALNPSEDWEEAFYKAAFTADNNSIVLQGASYNFNDINSDDIFICSYSLSGTQNYKRIYGGTAGDSPAGIVVQESGNIIFSSVIRGGGSNVSSYMGGGADGWLTCTNSSGAILWERTIGGTNLDYLYDLKIVDSSLLLTGSTRSENNTAILPTYGGLDCFLVFANPATGDTTKTIRWGSSLNDNAHSTSILASGALVTAGRTNGNDLCVHGSNGGTDLYVTRFNDPVTTSIKSEKYVNDISIFPNPGKGEFSVRTDKEISGGSYFVYNISGQIILQGNWASAQNQISIQIETPGIYFLSAANQTIRFVVLSKN
jgi:hypothetical protein